MSDSVIVCRLESFFLPSMREVGRLRDTGAAASGK